MYKLWLCLCKWYYPYMGVNLIRINVSFMLHNIKLYTVLAGNISVMYVQTLVTFSITIVVHVFSPIV